MNVRARYSLMRQCRARRGNRGKARLVLARLGMAGHGTARLGVARHGRAGEGRRGADNRPSLHLLPHHICFHIPPRGRDRWLSFHFHSTPAWAPVASDGLSVPGICRQRAHRSIDRNRQSALSFAWSSWRDTLCVANSKAISPGDFFHTLSSIRPDEYGRLENTITR